MRKTIDWLGWMSVFLTIISLIFTLLTTYQFTHEQYFYDLFSSFHTFQWCMFFTMLLWAVKLMDFKTNVKSIIGSVLCILIAVGSIFFMYMGVY